MVQALNDGFVAEIWDVGRGEDNHFGGNAPKYGLNYTFVKQKQKVAANGKCFEADAAFVVCSSKLWLLSRVSPTYYKQSSDTGRVIGFVNDQFKKVNQVIKH